MGRGVCVCVCENSQLVRFRTSDYWRINVRSTESIAAVANRDVMTLRWTSPIINCGHEWWRLPATENTVHAMTSLVGWNKARCLASGMRLQSDKRMESPCIFRNRLVLTTTVHHELEECVEDLITIVP